MPTADQLEPEHTRARLQRRQRPGQNLGDILSYRVGKLAYEAYFAAMGGMDFNSGAPLLPWAHLEQELREAWHAAADAVWNDCVALHRARGCEF